MLKYIFALLITLLITSCSSHSVKIQEKNSHKALFEQEDYYILTALRAEQLKDYASASQLFSMLYAKTKRKEYIYRELQNKLLLKDYKNIIQTVDKLIANGESDFVVIRMKIISLISLKKLTNAHELAAKLVEKSNDVHDDILFSDVLMQEGKFDSALEHLENVYQQDYNELILNKIAIILYFYVNRKIDAIEKLEVHSGIHGCSKEVCLKLIMFYAKENNIDALLAIYLKLYEFGENDGIAKKIVQIYSYKREYIKLIAFLEKSQSDNKTLLNLYSNTKNYTKAYQLAHSIYLETGNHTYLGQSAIYEYESSENKNDKKMLNAVIEKLQNVINQSQETLYLNYLGYVLIDHEIDINKGIKYVEDALKQEPKSVYYLDSLAWGYYKQGRCDDAKKIMNQVVELDGNENEEVIFHIQEIDKCLKN